MANKYKAVGLSAPKSFTFFGVTHWWAKSALPKGEYEALFKRAKSEDDFWKNNTVMASVEENEAGETVVTSVDIISIKAPLK